MQAAADVANRMLERESWARQRLAAHAGRTFSVAVGPVVTTLAIDPQGLFQSAPRDATPDLELTLAPWHVPTLAADPARWDTHVTAKGDAALAATLRELAQTTPLWIEQLFGRTLGPIAGQRAADLGRDLLRMPGHAAQRLTEGALAYLRDEADVLARGDEARVFAQEAARLAERTEALAARIEALSARLAGAPRAVPPA